MQSSIQIFLTGFIRQLLYRALTVVLCLQSLRTAVAATASTNAVAGQSVAVADFEIPDATAANKDWAYGLADVLAVELQQRGVTLFERQQIRVVLGERRISASGLIQLRGNPAQDIPELSFLVTGNIRELASGQFHLESALVAARTGRDMASFAREGHYPKDIPAALSALADELVARLKAENHFVLLPPPASAGSGAIPEVNLLFYKGVDYCLAGKPELGVTWFIDLQKTAPNFLPARVWTMRAFEMVGLPDFAAIARKRLREAPGGQGVLNCLSQSRFLNRQLVTVAVLADPQMDAAGWKFQAALKTGLGRCPGLFVADPANIRSLAAEMDLQLTENGSHDLELDSVLWSAVDVLALIRPAADAGGKSCLVELRDALSGEVLFHGQAPEAAAEMDDYCRKLATQIREQGKLSETGSLAGQAQARAVKPAQVSNTDRNEFAGLLKYLSENPSDRDAWMRLALFFPWLDAPYDRACFDRVLAATDYSEPDAAHWISEAIWHRRSYEGASRGYGTAPSIAVEATPLFEHFPDSPEAQYARSALALEYIDQKNYAAAAPILLKLAEDLPRLAGKVDIGPDYWANFYFFTAATLHETGDDVRARHFLARAAAVLKKNPYMTINGGWNGDSYGVWENHFPVGHPLFGENQELRQAVTVWQKQLNPTPKNAEQTTVSLDHLEALLNDAQQHYQADAEVKFFEFLRQLAEHERRHPELYQGRITEQDYRQPWRQIRFYKGGINGYYTLIGQFMVEAPGILQQLAEGGSTNRLAEVRNLAHELAESLIPEIAANFYEASGEYELALQKVEASISHPAPYTDAPSQPSNITATQAATRAWNPIFLRRQKIRLLQELGKKAEAAAYAESQIPAQSELNACRDAADAYAAIGRLDEACRIFAQFAKKTGPDDKMDAHGATVRLYWADYETDRGNYFAAADILRTVVRLSDGKGWDGNLRNGYAKTYDAAVSRLAKVRARAQQIPAASTDWEHPPQTADTVPLATNALTTEMEHALADILHGKSTGPNQTSYGYGVDDFIKKYGSNAVPVVLAAAGQGDFPAHLIAQFRLLDRIATPADAPAVLEVFKRTPRLAQTAFRLDATNATAILAERFAIFAKGGEIPPELLDIIGKYRLKDEYPVLIANLSVKELNGNLAPDAAAVDRALRHGATPAQRDSFRAVLSSMLEKQLLTTYRYGLDSLAETALRNGVPEGIEARLRCDNPVSTNSLVCLRKYMDLPIDGEQALAAVQAGLGRWRWDSKNNKFVMSETAAHPSAPASSRSETMN